MKLSKIAIVLGAAGMFLVGSGASHAQNWDGCSARVQKDQQDVDMAIDRYGYDSRQAQHEQAELQRDAARCGYDLYGNRDYRNGDDGRYRYPNPGYDDGYDGGYDRGYGNYNPAFDNGYRDGMMMGQRDSQRNKAFRPSKNDWYEDADRGYNRNYGDKNFYKREYRMGFQQGYSEGYKRWR